MASGTSSRNLTTAYSDTTTEPHNSGFCPPLPGAVFETVDSSVPYIVNACLNVPLVFTTTFANLLVLLAMRHITSIRLPSKLLLCSLVLTDLGAGLVVQPQFTAFLFIKGINPNGARHCFLAKSYYVAGSLFTFVSLLTITAISLDRYAALFFHMKYQQIVTVRRICVVLTFIWLYSLCFGLTLLWKKIVLWEAVLVTSMSICSLVVSLSNIKIYRRLKSQHVPHVQPLAQAQSQQQTGNTLNMAQYRKTASALLWIYALFILCYLPFLSLYLVILGFAGLTAITQCMSDFFYTAVLLNSCLNPFVYCLRLPEIRTEVLKQLRKICCRSSQQDTDPDDQQL